MSSTEKEQLIPAVMAVPQNLRHWGCGFCVTSWQQAEGMRRACSPGDFKLIRSPSTHLFTKRDTRGSLVSEGQFQWQYIESVVWLVGPACPALTVMDAWGGAKAAPEWFSTFPLRKHHGVGLVPVWGAALNPRC